MVALIKAHMEEEEAEHRRVMGEDGGGEAEDLDQEAVNGSAQDINNEPQR